MQVFPHCQEFSKTCEQIGTWLMIIVYQPFDTIYLSLRLTPWSRVFLEKLISATQEIPRIVWNPKVHYHVTTVRHLFLSWARSSPYLPPPIPLPEDPSLYYPPIYAWVFHVASYPQVSLPKACMHLSCPPHTYYTLHPSNSRFYHPNITWWCVHTSKLLVMYVSPLPCWRATDSIIK